MSMLLSVANIDLKADEHNIIIHTLRTNTQISNKTKGKLIKDDMIFNISGIILTSY